MWEEKFSEKQQGRRSCWLLFFTLNIITLVQLWVAGEGPTIEWSHHPRKIVREKKLSFRRNAYCIVMDAHLERFRRNTFLDMTTLYLATLTTSKILHVAWAVGHFFTLYMGFHGSGSTGSECLSVVTFDCEPPDYAPRTSARAHTWAVVLVRAFCAPRSREHEKRPAVEREKNADVPKKYYIDI